MKILWIGTGVMGVPMARHLLGAGHEVSVFSRTRSKAVPLEDAGATWVSRPREGAAQVDVVCTMLGHPSDVEEVILGNQGVLYGMCPGSLLIDFTTSRPELACRIQKEGIRRSVATLDAPVSGGDIGARRGSLSIMVGGDPAAFSRARPLFDVLGETVVLQGPSGTGQNTKLANQIVVAANMIGVCEALVYAGKAGLDQETVLRIFSNGAAASWCVNNLAPRMLRSDLEPGFYVEHFVKDLGIALEESRKLKLKLPGLELALSLYTELVEMGYAKKGTQALIRVLEERATG